MINNYKTKRVHKIFGVICNGKGSVIFLTVVICFLKYWDILESIMIPTSFKLSVDHPYMMNKGGRYENNNPFQAMTLKSLRKNFSIIPLFGALMLAGTLIQVASYNGLTKPGVNWTKVKDHSEYDGCCNKSNDYCKRPDYMKDQWIFFF